MVICSRYEGWWSVSVSHQTNIIERLSRGTGSRLPPTPQRRIRLHLYFLDLCRSSPDSGDLQCKSGFWKTMICSRCEVLVVCLIAMHQKKIIRRLSRGTGPHPPTSPQRRIISHVYFTDFYGSSPNSGDLQCKLGVIHGVLRAETITYRMIDLQLLMLCWVQGCTRARTRKTSLRFLP